MAKWITVRINLTRLDEIFQKEETIEFLSQLGDDTIEFGGMAGIVVETADKPFFKKVWQGAATWIKRAAAVVTPPE